MKTEPAGALPALTDRLALAEECKRLFSEAWDCAIDIASGQPTYADVIAGRFRGREKRRAVMDAIDRLAAALPQPPGSPPPLPKPARPARYYCNKCGAYPESDVHMAFRPTLSKRCHYLAAEIDPATYTADQMREYAAQAVASLPASSIAPPKSDVHLVGSQGHVLDAAS
jgi:hypothetical protein